LIISQRAAVYALITLALSPLSFALANDSAVSLESAVTEVKTAEAEQPQLANEEPTLEQAAEGVDASVISDTTVGTASQLPYDLKAAADIALAAFGGEVLKAEQIEDETGVHFHIRVVSEGRVRDVVIDAANGEIVKPIETPDADAVTGAAPVNVDASPVTKQQTPAAKEASE